MFLASFSPASESTRLAYQLHLAERHIDVGTCNSLLEQFGRRADYGDAMAEPTDHEAERKKALLEAIDRSARGKYTPMIKTLMAEFGFNATYRVRQSSLADVTRTLADWGIGHEFPGGVSSLDYIRLFRMSSEDAQTRLLSSLPPNREAPSTYELPVSPFELVFEVGDAREEARSVAQAQDVLAAVWSSRPVMLFVDAVDEFFALSGGVVAAVMRRRESMVRSGGYGPRGPTAPEILCSERLKALVGQVDAAHGSGDFPMPGAVYLYRDDAEHGQDDEVAALVREMFIPHTYRLRARFASTAGEPTAGSRAVDDPRFPAVLSWLALYAGAPLLAQTIEKDRLVDLSSLFAEASQIRETLLDRATLEATDPGFRAGFESSEHMVIKNLVAKSLRVQFPESDVEVERSLSTNDGRSRRADQDEPGDSDLEGEDRAVRGRPDVRVEGQVAVEVETMRSLVLPGSNPFFTLEQKLRRKLDVYKSDRQLWLVVPNDVALLAEQQLHALIRNLSAGRERQQICLGTMDLKSGQVCFLKQCERTRVDIRLVGASWREQRRETLTKLTWADVAGYSDVKKRLYEDVLAPLRDPSRYARHKLGSSNGLLLYGLPGCGKSLIGRVLAGEADLPCRRIVPSDMTSAWLGEGTMKIREQFDWAVKQNACLMVIDELDAIAPQRREHNMHSDEKRQVNELLTQLDRVQGKPIIVVGTTNYFQGIDSAVRRSGRFDVKLPVFPPNEQDRKLIYDYYLGPERLAEIDGIDSIDTVRLANASPLFAPVDIRIVVETAARRAIARTKRDDRPRMDEPSLIAAIRSHSRSIQARDAIQWVEEAEGELGTDDPHLRWLRGEIELAYPQ